MQYLIFLSPGEHSCKILYLIFPDTELALQNMDRAIQGKILLVGEGDFSFTVALVTKLSKIGESEVVATSLETSDSISKHRNAAENMEILKGKGKFDAAFALYLILCT